MVIYLHLQIENAPELHDKEDFTVVMQPFVVDIALPAKPDGLTDFSLLSADCFHFSQKGLAWSKKNTNLLQNNTKTLGDLDETSLVYLFIAINKKRMFSQTMEMFTNMWQI